MTAKKRKSVMKELKCYAVYDTLNNVIIESSDGGLVSENSGFRLKSPFEPGETITLWHLNSAAQSEADFLSNEMNDEDCDEEESIRISIEETKDDIKKLRSDVTLYSDLLVTKKHLVKKPIISKKNQTKLQNKISFLTRKIEENNKNLNSLNKELKKFKSNYKSYKKDRFQVVEVVIKVNLQGN